MTDINQSITNVAANTADLTASQNYGATIEEGYKVFARNLAFATTEEELKTVFSEAGTVTNAQIITRGTRSLGYGFVTFSSEADAQKAIQSLSGKEIAGRQISVESAKPQTVKEFGEGAKSGKSRTRTRSTKARSGAAAARRPRTDEGEEGGAEASTPKDAESALKPNAEGTSKSARRRQKKKAAAAVNGDSPVPAAPKPKREKPAGEPSKTLVFVANLSFETTDEKLKESFSDFKLTSAHVVKRRVGNRSKGFGFVDFTNEEEQKKAIEGAQNREIDGRPVSLKVAIQEDKKEVEQAQV